MMLARFENLKDLTQRMVVDGRVTQARQRAEARVRVEELWAQIEQAETADARIALKYLVWLGSEVQRLYKAEEKARADYLDWVLSQAAEAAMGLVELERENHHG